MHTHDVLKAIQAASDAYDLVPELRRQVDDTQHILDRTKDDLSNAQGTNLALTREIEVLKQKLSATEVERDQYFFRAEEANEKLEKITSLVRPVATASEPGQSSDAGQSVSVTQDDPLSYHPTKEELAATADARGESVPFVDASSQDSGGTASAAPTTDLLATSIAAPQTFSGQRYYDKPRDVSWEVFEAGGGEHKPVWMD